MAQEVEIVSDGKKSGLFYSLRPSDAYVRQ